jgi:signal transduction histidine kinase
MVLLVSVMVLVFVLVINRHSLPEDPASYLVDVVIDNANDVEFDRGTFEWDDLSVYKRGVYCSFYNTNGDLLLSADKADMDFSSEPFKANQIRTVKSGDKEFYLYDYYVDMEVSGLWIRGAVLTDSHVGITDIILRLTLMILPIILVITFLGALWISSRTFKPIEQIVATANSINDADDLTDRIALKRGPKEMKQLAGAFDRMFERLEKLFDAERQFTSDASHELRTPTAIILAECDRAKRKAVTLEDYRESIDNISEQGHRMTNLIDELLGITRLQQGT